MRFLYFYLMRGGAAERLGTVAPRHAAYWHELSLPEYVGGPFTDRMGGLITFEASSLTEAERLAAADPFVVEDLLERRWVKGWMID